MTIYEKYGKLMVQLEIIQNQINEVKKEIQADILKQTNKISPEDKKEEDVKS